MIVQTWGFVKTRPNNPWTRVELRAEPGAVLRISGTSYSSALASFARVRSALQSVGISWPGKALTLHLHPPCSSDELAQLDLAIAVAFITIQGRAHDTFNPHHVGFFGMLSLDGAISDPKPGQTSPETFRATHQNIPPSLRELWSPNPSRPHESIAVECTPHLSSVAQQLNSPRPPVSTEDCDSIANLEDVFHGISINRGWDHLDGEAHAKKWLCIAAKYRIPVLMTGPPGVGKSSLARGSVGLLEGKSVPFLAPHPSGGTAGLLGSWRRGQPVMGAWAMANQGALFLDEFPEWPRPAREALRHIMDTGELHLHRADGFATWKSNAWILAAMNMCPCGQQGARCICTSSERQKYLKRLSAPLLERFPVQLEVGAGDDDGFSHPWSECQSWVQCESDNSPIPWSRKANHLFVSISKQGMTSKRLQHHLRTLAEGHARWCATDEVQEADIHEAHGVMWMTRPGWQLK